MTREEAIEMLKEFQGSGDVCDAHVEADDVLCYLLIELGYQDVVDEYRRVPKWFE